MDEQKRNRIIELQKALQNESAPAGLLELLKELESSVSERMEGRELCLRTLAKNPQNNLVRLHLAKLYYQDELYEFCIRELLELKRSTNIDSVNRLLEAFGDHVTKFLPTPSMALTSANLKSTSAESQQLAEKRGKTAGAGDPSEESSVFAELDIETDFLEAVERLKDQT